MFRISSQPTIGHRWLQLAAATWLVALPTSLDAQQPVVLPAHELIFSRQANPDRTNYDVWRVCGDGSQLASRSSWRRPHR